MALVETSGLIFTSGGGKGGEMRELVHCFDVVRSEPPGGTVLLIIIILKLAVTQMFTDTTRTSKRNAQGEACTQNGFSHICM